MSEMSKFVRQIFEDADGCYSSKRTTVAIAMIMFIAAFVADLAWKVTITQFIFDGVMWVILGGLGLTLGEGPIKEYMNRISGGKSNLSATSTEKPEVAAE